MLGGQHLLQFGAVYYKAMVEIHHSQKSEHNFKDYCVGYCLTVCILTKEL